MAYSLIVATFPSAEEAGVESKSNMTINRTFPTAMPTEPNAVGIYLERSGA
jgi:hypothetical protein